MIGTDDKTSAISDKAYDKYVRYAWRDGNGKKLDNSYDSQVAHLKRENLELHIKIAEMSKNIAEISRVATSFLVKYEKKCKELEELKATMAQTTFDLRSGSAPE